MNITISDNAKLAIDKYIDYFINTKFHIKIKNRPSEAFIKDNIQNYPAPLLYLWQEIGFACFEKGGFWLVNPAEYQDLLDICLKDTKFPEHDDFIVIGRTAFGELIAMGKKTASKLTIDMDYLRIFPYIVKNVNLTDKDFAIPMLTKIWTEAEKDSFDTIDFQQKKLFDRCLASHGQLKEDEMYAFTPPLALGGQRDFYNIEKVNIHQHLNFVAQLEPFTIMMDINAVVDDMGITP